MQFYNSGRKTILLLLQRITINQKEKTMKSLIKKEKKNDAKIAQCCAKVSKIAAGCHD